jgi:hypothetical protein
MSETTNEPHTMIKLTSRYIKRADQLAFSKEALHANHPDEECE